MPPVAVLDLLVTVVFDALEVALASFPERRPDRFMQRRLVAFDRQQVVPALAPDLGGDRHQVSLRKRIRTSLVEETEP